MATAGFTPINVAATRCETPASDTTTLQTPAVSSTIVSAASTPPTSIADSMSVSSPREKNIPEIKSIFNDHDTDDDYDALPASRASLAVSEVPPVSIATLLQGDRSYVRPTRERRSLPVSYNVNQNINALSGFMYKSARTIRQRTQTTIQKDINYKPLTRRRRRTATGITPEGHGDNSQDGAEVVEKEKETPTDEARPSKRRQVAAGNGVTSIGEKTDGAEGASDSAPGELTATETASISAEELTIKLRSIRNRRKNAADPSLTRMERELRSLQDADESRKDGKEPVREIVTIWSKGKLVDPNAPPPVKATATKEKPVEPEIEIPSDEPKKVAKTKPVYLEQGLYAGQEDYVDLSLTPKERKAQAKVGAKQTRKILPLPMWAGQRLILDGRDFKIPFDVFNPLPPGQPKPVGWTKMVKNRFVGDAAAQWRKPLADHNSKCGCKPEDGCGEDCHNRLMLYECVDSNCAIGAKHCTNRAFAELLERTKATKAVKYNIGVEVVKTEDRGYGVRANRSFNAGQIIVEYCGEIITQVECDRRMKNEYKDNECYYLMSFTQNMIIDATRVGSIARFVNHSCEPNCAMVKWLVAGKMRMALFAERDICTGEELTYDYNFENFSQKSVKQCRCGSKNCRGVLGPREQHKKPGMTEGLAKAMSKAVKSAVVAGKRKLKEYISGGPLEEENPEPAKKRKNATPKAATSVPEKVLGTTSRNKGFKAVVSPAAGKKTSKLVTTIANGKKIISTSAKAKTRAKAAQKSAKGKKEPEVAEPAAPPRITLKLTRKPEKVQQKLKFFVKPAASQGEVSSPAARKTPSKPATKKAMGGRKKSAA